MKKYIAFLLCIIIITSLVSCNSNKEQNNTQTPNSTLTGDNILEESGKNDNLTSQPSENDIAMQMYEAAIKDEICVFDEHLGEIKLKACRFPSDNTRLDECKLLTKAILDLDQDGVNEYVIQSPNNEHIILHYYDGKVYSYCFDSSHFCNLSTDGTFYWHDSPVTGNWEGGLNKIIFEGETLNIRSIWSLKYSEKSATSYYETDNYEYYIDGNAVTIDDYLDYYNRNYKTRMTFTPFEPTCSYPITAEQAWDLANTYWNNVDGSREGAAGTLFVNKVVLLDTPSADTNDYCIALQAEWFSNFDIRKDCNPPREIRVYKELLVNAFTGEVTEYGSDGVSWPYNISHSEAVAIARNYWARFDIEENGYIVERGTNGDAPSSVYVFVIRRYVIDHYSTFDEIWVDKNTGETIIPYSPDGK